MICGYFVSGVVGAQPSPHIFQNPLYMSIKLGCQSVPKNYTTIAGNGVITPDKKNRIQWHLVNTSKNLQKWKAIAACKDVFLILEREFGGIRFESVENEKHADIVIRFASNDGNHNLPKPPIPFEDGVLAYAYAIRGDVWVNDDYYWTLKSQGSGYDIILVLVHEVLHALNLGHTDAIGDIMLPEYNRMNKITSDTRAGIRHLYGRYMAKKLNANSEKGKIISYIGGVITGVAIWIIQELLGK